ncbi:hypothetical protein ES705_47354 [subsurface metagenome]
MKYTTTYTNVNPLRQGWCKLLDHYKWTWFTTLTFKDFPKTYTAINRFNAFIRVIQGKEKVDIGYYVGMELTKLGCPHFHSLMGNLGNVQRSIWWKWWFTRYGAARIEPYDPKLGASHYVTKYITKRFTWYDIKGLEYMNQLTFDKKTEWCIITKPVITQGV